MDNHTFEFHPLLQEIYSQVIEELADDNKFSGYRNLKAKIVNANLYSSSDPKYIAAQFHMYFPGHLFKVQNLLHQLFQQKKLNLNSPLVVLDIGCGSGAASLAFINALLHHVEDINLLANIEIYFIGIDPSQEALHIYKMLLDKFEQKLGCAIHLDRIPKGIPDANLDAIKYLEIIYSNIDKENIPQIIAFQSNIIPALEIIKEKHNQNIEDLVKNDFPEAVKLTTQYGQSLRDFYKQLLRDIPLDNLIVFTIATDSSHEFEELFNQIGNELVKVVEAVNFQLNSLTEANSYTVIYKNPKSSHFSWNKKPYGDEKIYFADIKHFSCIDSVWEKLIATDNLKLAWVRSRYAQQREALTDEVEIRSIERSPEKLEQTLSDLQNRIINYDNKLGLIEYRIPYPFPKNEKQVRPRILTNVSFG